MGENIHHIIKKSVAGDDFAKRKLYEMYKIKWYMTCMRYGRSRYEADDILQDGLVNIYKDLSQFDPSRGQFSTWSNRVIVNAALRYLKQNTWYNEFKDIDVAININSNEETIYDELSMKELTLILQQLPVGYRVVFNMYALEGYTHKEIAETLGISIGASKSQLSKARAKLRTILERHFITS